MYGLSVIIVISIIIFSLIYFTVRKKSVEMYGPSAKVTFLRYDYMFDAKDTLFIDNKKHYMCLMFGIENDDYYSWVLWSAFPWGVTGSGGGIKGVDYDK